LQKMNNEFWCFCKEKNRPGLDCADISPESCGFEIIKDGNHCIGKMSPNECQNVLQNIVGPSQDILFEYTKSHSIGICKRNVDFPGGKVSILLGKTKCGSSDSSSDSIEECICPVSSIDKMQTKCVADNHFAVFSVDEKISHKCTDQYGDSMWDFTTDYDGDGFADVKCSLNNTSTRILVRDEHVRYKDQHSSEFFNKIDRKQKFVVNNIPQLYQMSGKSDCTVDSPFKYSTFQLQELRKVLKQSKYNIKDYQNYPTVLSPFQQFGPFTTWAINKNSVTRPIIRTRATFDKSDDYICPEIAGNYGIDVGNISTLNGNIYQQNTSQQLPKKIGEIDSSCIGWMKMSTSAERSKFYYEPMTCHVYFLNGKISDLERPCSSHTFLNCYEGELGEMFASSGTFSNCAVSF
jgi:hypothetical protein